MNNAKGEWPVTQKAGVAMTINAATGAVERAAVGWVAAVRRQGWTAAEVGILWAAGTVIYVYFFAVSSLSIDDEVTGTYTDYRLWVANGRWFGYLLGRALFPQPAIPHAPYLLFTLCLALSYGLMVRMHGMAPSWKTYACFGVYCAFPSFWFLLEFNSNVPGLGVGLVLVSLAAYLSCGPKPIQASRAVAIVVLLACSVGSYQSFLMLYFCQLAGVALTARLRNHGATAVGSCESQASIGFTRAAHLFVLVLAALTVYALLNFGFQHVLGARNQYLQTNFLQAKQLQHPAIAVYSVVQQAWYIYSGQTHIYGAPLPAAPILLIVAAAAVATGRWRGTSLRLLLFATVLGIPFALHFLSDPFRLPIRTMVALPYVVWLLALVALSWRSVAARLAVLATVMLFQFQLVTLISQYAVSATLAQEHDRLLAADIYRRTGELDNTFDRTKLLQIDVYGRKEFSTKLFAKGVNSTTQASFFGWDGGNLERMVLYMHMLGYGNLTALASAAERRALTTTFETMPVWPAAGSAQRVGDTVLVRLSKEPDPAHESAAAPAQK